MTGLQLFAYSRDQLEPMFGNRICEKFEVVQRLPLLAFRYSVSLVSGQYDLNSKIIICHTALQLSIFLSLANYKYLAALQLF